MSSTLGLYPLAEPIAADDKLVWNDSAARGPCKLGEGGKALLPSVGQHVPCPLRQGRDQERALLAQSPVAIGRPLGINPAAEAESILDLVLWNQCVTVLRHEVAANSRG